MFMQEEINLLQQRLARAEAERDTWRAAGQGERYQEACFRVEALELQINRLRAGASTAQVDTRPGYLSK